MISGFVLCGAIYAVFFNFLSETMLVMISPIWFLLIHFGISGYYTEKAVKLIIEKKCDNIKIALNEVIEKLPLLIRLIVRLVFLPVHMLININKIFSPLVISFLTTVIWAVILYMFFGLIFSSM